MAIDEKKENTAAVQARGHVVPAVLFGPRVSEKSSRLANGSKYVFNVTKTANKIEVKRAVEKAYHVNVVQVNISNTKGKTRNFGRIAGRTAGFKKAIVTLRAGQKIEGATETI